ncbi:hypothetical protein KW837_26700 [Pseudomonas sp. PDM24]|uniref:hypothetical protein n=1 Tax=Pseudomonas sp. PDM24 TaxID=2854777 RepID=UPI001C48A758|nr:hypothetical protein [Pseudomonas sp. PDM24]MBV7497863.1 hypothetical protein [Pseudomonas sp. PDM24]
MSKINYLELVPAPFNAPPLVGDRIMFSVTLSSDGSLAGVYGQHTTAFEHYFGYWVNRNGTTTLYQPQYSIPASQVLWPWRLINNAGKLAGCARLVDGTYRVFEIDTFTGTFTDIPVPVGIRQVSFYGILDSGLILSHFDVWPGPTLLTTYILNDGAPRTFNIPGYVQNSVVRNAPSEKFLVITARKASDPTTTFRTLLLTNGLEIGIINEIDDKIIVEIDDNGNFVRMEKNSPLPSWEAPGVLVLNGAVISIPTKFGGNKFVDARQSILKHDGMLLGVYRSTNNLGDYSGLFTFQDGVISDLTIGAAAGTQKFKNIVPTRFNGAGQISLATQSLGVVSRGWDSYRCFVS